MNDIPIVWVVSDEQISGVRRKKRPGIILVVALLCVMAAAEVLFLNSTAAPDSVALMKVWLPRIDWTSRQRFVVLGPICKFAPRDLGCTTRPCCL